MFQPLSLKLNSGLTTTVTLCFSLHLLTLCKITTWTDAFYMTRLSQICWIVCLFHRKTSIKIIYLFLGTWQEANMLYFPGQKAENFLKVALMSWFQSRTDTSNRFLVLLLFLSPWASTLSLVRLQTLEKLQFGPQRCHLHKQIGSCHND